MSSTAEESVLMRCSTCEKRQGTCLCGGCKRYFCMGDFRNHRSGLSKEMDVIISDRDDLQDKINKSSDKITADNRLLLQIAEWEQKTIAKVRETAELVREEFKLSLKSQQEEIKNQLNGLSKELVEMQETEDFIESDLSRFRQKIEQFNQDLRLLDQSSMTQLNTEESDRMIWSQLIYVEGAFNKNGSSSNANTNQDRIVHDSLFARALNGSENPNNRRLSYKNVAKKSLSNSTMNSGSAHSNTSVAENSHDGMKTTRRSHKPSEVTLWNTPQTNRYVEEDIVIRSEPSNYDSCEEVVW